MTKERLMQIYYIEKEIASWKEELEKAEATGYISGTKLIPTSGGRMPDRAAQLAVNRAETEKKIKKKLLELEKAKNEITNYILGIDDCQTRLIFKLRCLNLLTWNEVADKVGGMNSEYTVKKRFYRYLEKCG